MVGMVGCGYFAQFHIEAWRRIPGVELAAAADPVLARARQAAPQAYSAEEMFDASGWISSTSPRVRILICRWCGWLQAEKLR